MKPLTVLLADDHNLMREGLASLLGAQPDIKVLGQASTGAEATQLAEELAPQLVLMDVSMPDMNGIEATRHIKKQQPSTRVIGLSMHTDRRFVVRMLQAGARGYLMKNTASTELLSAIQCVMDGQIFLSPKVAGEVVQDMLHNTSGKDSSAFSVLTAREREVLQLVAEGKRSKEIADVLSISPRTAEAHVHNIRAKLELNSVAELTKYAIREGLTSFDIH